MVFSLRNLILGASLAAGGVFDRDVARRSQGQESAAGLVRTALCTPEGDLSQTQPLTRVQGSVRLIVGDRNRLQRRALDLGAAKLGSRSPGSPPKVHTEAKNSEVQQTQAAANVGEGLRRWRNIIGLWPIALPARA
jgi:hypothetical protein